MIHSGVWLPGVAKQPCKTPTVHMPVKRARNPDHLNVGLSNQKLISVILHSVVFDCCSAGINPCICRLLLSFAFVQEPGLVYFCVFATLILCFSPVPFVVIELFLPWKARTTGLRAGESLALGG